MSSDGPTVLFRALSKPLQLSADEKRAVRSFARTIWALVADRRAFTCVVADDAELCRLNGTFLGHHYPTDVLSFPSDNSATLVPDLGEMIISLERAQAQAEEFRHERTAEISVLMLHGVLHLMGFDHERDRGEMARAERKWREHLNLPTGVIARAATRSVAQ